MPAIGSKLVLDSAAQSSNVVLADINLIGGATYGVPSFSDLESISSEYVQDGQIMFVADEALFYSATVTVGGPPSFATTISWDEVSLGQADTSSFLTSADTGSFLTSADTSSFVLVSGTSSMSVATASYVSPTFISASAAASGFGAGGGSIPSGTISSSQQITDFGFISSSIDTSLFVLVSETGSFLTAEDTGSFILASDTSSMSVATASYVDPTFISASAAASGFGAGGDSIPSGTVSSSQQITDFGFISSSVDISALNTFTGSIQTEVDSLTNATSSYLTADSTGSFITSDVTSSMSVATASYALYAVSASYEILTELSSSHAIQADTASFISDAFISASAVRSGFGSGNTLPIGTISGSQQITNFGFISSSVDISALNEFSGSIQDQVDALIAATGSYLDDTNTILVTQSEPSATAGGIYFDGNNFYLGL